MTSEQESTNALMATLGEYDTLWDGTLTPEIIDAEYFDCPDGGRSDCGLIGIPFNLHLYYTDRDLIQIFERDDALLAIIATITTLVEEDRIGEQL